MIDNFTLTLYWNTEPVNIWQRQFYKLGNTNLLQCAAYAKSQSQLYQQRIRFGFIQIDGQEAGIVMILEAGALKNALHAVILDRGPLWFDGYGSEEHICAFFAEFARQFPRRFGRKRRVIPEILETQGNRSIMEKHGFRRNAAPGYQTLYLDITKDDEQLRKNLRKNWRGSLQKAEKARGDMRIEWDNKCEFLHWFLKIYALDKAEKGYSGASAKTLIEFAKTFGASRDMLIGRVFYKDHPISAVLILCHGDGATYQAGWNKPPQEHRNIGAHNLLLWDTIRVLKDKGITHFDLGGINDESASGIKNFKEGLAGKKYGTHIQLCGQYS